MEDTYQKNQKQKETRFDDTLALSIWGWGIICVSIFKLIFCLISFLAYVLSLLVVCYLFCICSRSWSDRSILITVLLPLLSDSLLLVRELFWRHLWYVLLTALLICLSKSKLSVLIQIHRILSIAVCHLKYGCIFAIQDIPAQILCLCSNYAAYSHHIQNQQTCNVFLAEVKMLLQDRSDYLVRQPG